MRKTRIFLFGILFLALALISFKTVHALFTSSNSNLGNSFTAAAEFPELSPTPTSSPTTSPTPSPIPEILINEVFNSSSSAEWVELYNPTDLPMDVSGWKLTDNGDEDVFSTIPLIPANGYAMVITDTSVVSVPSGAVEIRLNNGSIGDIQINGTEDFILLRKPDNSIVDALSWGADNTVFPQAAPAIPQNQSIARQPNGFDSNLGSDWKIDTSPTPGGAN